MVPVRPSEAIPVLAGRENRILYRFLISNDLVHMARVDLPPGHRSDVELHGGDEIACVLSGVLSVLTGQADTRSVSAERLEAHAGRKVFLPRGTPHWYSNYGEETASVVIAVAPSLFAEEAG